MAEEGALLPQACPEGVEVYRQVHHEGALGQADLQEEVLVMTSHFPHPRYDLREEGEEGVLSVLKGFFQEMAVSRLVEEGEVLPDHVMEVEYCC